MFEPISPPHRYRRRNPARQHGHVATEQFIREAKLAREETEHWLANNPPVHTAPNEAPDAE